MINGEIFCDWAAHARFHFEDCDLMCVHWAGVCVLVDGGLLIDNVAIYVHDEARTNYERLQLRKCYSGSNFQEARCVRLDLSFWHDSERTAKLLIYWMKVNTEEGKEVTDLHFVMRKMMDTDLTDGYLIWDHDKWEMGACSVIGQEIYSSCIMRREGKTQERRNGLNLE